MDELDRAVAEPDQEQRLHQAAPRLGRELRRVFHAADRVIAAAVEPGQDAGPPVHDEPAIR